MNNKIKYYETNHIKENLCIAVYVEQPFVERTRF